MTRFDESFVFYRDALGLQPTWGGVGSNYASFAFTGGGQIALFKRELMTEAVVRAPSPAAAPSADVFALVLTVDDVDAAYRRLRGKGVQFVAPPQNREVWGIRAAHFRDPDGHLIEMFSSLRK